MQGLTAFVTYLGTMLDVALNYTIPNHLAAAESGEPQLL